MFSAIWQAILKACLFGKSSHAVFHMTSLGEYVLGKSLREGGDICALDMHGDAWPWVLSLFFWGGGGGFWMSHTIFKILVCTGEHRLLWWFQWPIRTLPLSEVFSLNRNFKLCVFRVEGKWTLQKLSVLYGKLDFLVSISLTCSNGQALRVHQLQLGRVGPRSRCLLLHRRHSAQ